MSHHTYLDWLLANTKTEWWHDSADLEELEIGLERGAVGVTSNPYLTNLAVQKYRQQWAAEIDPIVAKNPPPEEKAEALMRVALTKCAQKLLPVYERTQGRMGYICAQVNPSRAGDRDGMQAMARRFHQWAPNIAVKLPCTAAGLDVMEDCIADAITITMTVSFTVPQVLAVGERYRRGAERARQKGIQPGRCFAVIMIGRLDDYLRDVAADSKAPVSEEDIRQAGLAVTKRAYQLYKRHGYEPVLLVAALRGPYHLTELAGAELVMSIAPAPQKWFVEQDLPREPRIDRPVPQEVIDRLATLPEFIKAYEPGGMKPEEFISYGVSQKTLCQFVEAGWRLLEAAK